MLLYLARLQSGDPLPQAVRHSFGDHGVQQRIPPLLLLIQLFDDFLQLSVFLLLLAGQKSVPLALILCISWLGPALTRVLRTPSLLPLMWTVTPSMTDLIEGELQLGRLLRSSQDQLSAGVVEVQVVHVHAHLYHVLHRLDAADKKGTGSDSRGKKTRKNRKRFRLPAERAASKC